jgi:hypothetical protein
MLSDPGERGDRCASNAVPHSEHAISGASARCAGADAARARIIRGKHMLKKHSSMVALVAILAAAPASANVVTDWDEIAVKALQPSTATPALNPGLLYYFESPLITTFGAFPKN